MTREEKNQFIDTLAEKLTDNNHFYLTDISGLTVSDSNDLRRLCFNKGVSLEVVKNTLLKNAMERAERDYTESYDVLKGNTAILFCEVGNVPAKLIREFRKKHDKPVLKAAYVEEVFYFGDEQLSILSDIKSKNEVIGDIIGLLQSPVKNVISALQSGGNKLSAILKTLSEKVQEAPKEETKPETATVEEASTSDSPSGIKNIPQGKETGAAPSGEATESGAEESSAEIEEPKTEEVEKAEEVDSQPTDSHEEAKVEEDEIKEEPKTEETEEKSDKN